MTETLWLLVVGGGPLLIGVLLAYALLQRRRKSAGEKAAQRAAIRRSYEEDEMSNSESVNPRNETAAVRSLRQEQASVKGKPELVEGLEDTFPASDQVSVTSPAKSGAPADAGQPQRVRAVDARQ